MHPVTLFPFHKEVILKAASIWFVVTRLRDHIDRHLSLPIFCPPLQARDAFAELRLLRRFQAALTVVP